MENEIGFDFDTPKKDYVSLNMMMKHDYIRLNLFNLDLNGVKTLIKYGEEVVIYGQKDDFTIVFVRCIASENYDHEFQHFETLLYRTLQFFNQSILPKLNVLKKENDIVGLKKYKKYCADHYVSIGTFKLDSKQKLTEDNEIEF